jgi:hypothetical protein
MRHNSGNLRAVGKTVVDDQGEYATVEYAIVPVRLSIFTLRAIPTSSRPVYPYIGGYVT